MRVCRCRYIGMFLCIYTFKKIYTHLFMLHSFCNIVLELTMLNPSESVSNVALCSSMTHANSSIYTATHFSEF